MSNNESNRSTTIGGACSEGLKKGEIVMYQPDETIRLEVRMEGETVWLSQAQMAELFGTGRQAITKHLQNIYECKELEKDATSSILELVRKEGKRNVKRKIEFYNLDAIISVGFRVCGLRLWCQPEGCRQEALRLHPHARDLSLGTAE